MGRVRQPPPAPQPAEPRPSGVRAPGGGWLDAPRSLVRRLGPLWLGLGLGLLLERGRAAAAPLPSARRSGERRARRRGSIFSQMLDHASVLPVPFTSA